MHRDDSFLQPADSASRSGKIFPVDASCFADEQAASSLKGLLGEMLRLFGILHFDLAAFDGLTLAKDCRAAAIAIQKPPDEAYILPSVDLPSTLEMARTIAVWRGEQLRFHIVLHAEVGEMILSEDEEQQSLAMACLAHELAHVQHEGKFYRKFPHLYRGKLECGNRDGSIFIEAMNVWSEYAACRSSASFRPEALEEHGELLQRAVQQMLTSGLGDGDQEKHVAAANLLLSAGYLLGELDGLDLEMEFESPSGSSPQEKTKLVSALDRLKNLLRELWKTEDDWQTIEVFVPIYDLLLELG